MSWSVERELARRALDTAEARGASYADTRFVRRITEDALVKNGRIESVDRGETFGFGIRTIADGAWGFAASAVTTPQEVDRVAALAAEIAKASALTKIALLLPAESFGIQVSAQRVPALRLASFEFTGATQH
ncbi:hypothetical protein BH18CHL2_BH18CHL2_03010 [soil metagenome]